MGSPLRSLFIPVGRGRQVSDSLTSIHVPPSCTFIGLISFKRAVDAVQSGDLEIEFSDAVLVDHTFMHEIRTVEREYTDSGRKVILKGLERLTPVSDHSAACRRVVSDVHPRQALVRG